MRIVGRICRFLRRGGIISVRGSHLAIGAGGLHLVLRSGVGGRRPVGFVVKPASNLRLAEEWREYRWSGRIGPLYWRTFAQASHRQAP